MHMHGAYFTHVLCFFKRGLPPEFDQTCHFFGSDTDLKSNLQNFRVFPPKRGTPKLPLLGSFTAKSQYSANIFERKYALEYV